MNYYCIDCSETASADLCPGCAASRSYETIERLERKGLAERAIVDLMRGARYSVQKDSHGCYIVLFGQGTFYTSRIIECADIELYHYIHKICRLVVNERFTSFPTPEIAAAYAELYLAHC